MARDITVSFTNNYKGMGDAAVYPEIHIFMECATNHELMTDSPNNSPTLVTCALPYANGKAHIGHLRTYIPGDTFTRALRKLGQEVVFVCGSDMHGTPIVVNAEEEGVEPEELALGYHEYFMETFPRIDVDFDNYGHTHQESNVRRTQQIVTELEERGYIYKDTMMVAYDPEHDRTLPDRYVEGECPYCGNDEARGDECDECGRHLEPGEIIDPVSKVSGAEAEYVEQEHRFFALSEFRDYLSEFVDGLEGTSNAKNQPKQWIEEGLQDWCITRDLDWGVPYPGEEELVLYVWVDAPMEYIASTEEWASKTGDPEAWRDYWLNDDSNIIHVIGGDIIQHHCVFWPALLEGAGYAAPDAILASGLVKINDRAFSTSKGRAVWLDEDYLDEGFPPDLIRYYIVSYTGFENDLNFSWELFQERVNNELVDTLGNFTYRSLLLTHNNFDEVPEGTPDPEVRDEIESVCEQFRGAVDSYNVKGVAEAGMSLAGYGNEYIQKREPWKLLENDRDEASNILYNCLQITKALAILIEPVMPGAANDLWNQLDEDGSVHEAGLDDALSPVSDKVGEPHHLFEKIEDEKINSLDERLQERVGGEDEHSISEAGTEGLDPIREETVSFDKFQELDLRVARIVGAEPIEDSDNLMLLKVDLGIEERQLVAGLKGLHSVDELEGRKIVVVANLEPTEIFGYESQGMLLAAGEDAELVSVDDAEPGTKIV